MKTICTVTGPDGIARDFEPTNSSSGTFCLPLNKGALAEILPGANGVTWGADDRNACFEVEDGLFVTVTHQTLNRRNFIVGRPQVEEADAEVQFIVVSDYRRSA